MAACTHGQVNLLKLKLSIRIKKKRKKKKDLNDFERAIVVTATDDLLGFTQITIYRVCSEYSERENIQ